MDLTRDTTEDDRIARLTFGLINVALSKAATQSSYSQWSRDDEAGQAVSCEHTDDFAFHTDYEENPWWEVDLGAAYPIEAIIVHNRKRLLQERARTLKIEVSHDDRQWILIHAGIALFGSAPEGRPFEMFCGGLVEARYVRLSLTEKQYLHLSKVEVFVRPDLVIFGEFCRRFGLPRYFANENPTNSVYVLEANKAVSQMTVVGVRINYSGRFGNLLHQYVNAIQFAQRTNLKYVQLGRHELFDVATSFSVGGITFLPSDAELPLDGYFISGEFFNSDDFIPILSPFLQFGRTDEYNCTSVVQEYVRPHMLTGVPLPDEQHLREELTIHLRSGDIFNSDHPVTYGYRQPPLSFYTLVVTRMRDQRRINKVRLIFEDRGNPCVNALEEWLGREGIPCRVDGGSLAKDMSALVDAPHLVFGHGTFGYAACRLSRRNETVHYFAPELGGSYGFMPTIQDVFSVSDRQGEYIKAFEYGKPFGPHDGWRNTSAMRETMLSYPIEWLQIDEIPRALRA